MDQIRQGRYLLFPGNSRFYQTVCIMLPLLALFHMFVVLFVSSRNGLRAYFRVRFITAHRPDLRMSMLGISLKGTILIALCCLCLVITNFASPDIFDCSVDPLVRTSVAPVQFTVFYEWLFVILNGMLLMITALVLDSQQSGSVSKQAEAVHQLFCQFVRQNSPLSCQIQKM